jgi:hypothetical protein
MADETNLQNVVTQETQENLGVTPTPVPQSRDQVRAQIFASKTVKKKLVDFFGVKIEIRQPQLADILQARKEGEQSGVIGILVDHAYVPNTDQKIFEPTDKDALLQMPFGGDFLEVSNALEELTNVNFQPRGKNS